MVKVAPSLAVGSGAAFATPPTKKGVSLLRDRGVSKRSRISAKVGGDGEVKPAGKKFITREEEPDQYWQTAGERKGENPMMTRCRTSSSSACRPLSSSSPLPSPMAGSRSPSGELLSATEATAVVRSNLGSQNTSSLLHYFQREP